MTDLTADLARWDQIVSSGTTGSPPFVDGVSKDDVIDEAVALIERLRSEVTRLTERTTPPLNNLVSNEYMLSRLVAWLRDRVDDGGAKFSPPTISDLATLIEHAYLPASVENEARPQPLEGTLVSDHELTAEQTEQFDAVWPDGWTHHHCKTYGEWATHSTSFHRQPLEGTETPQ